MVTAKTYNHYRNVKNVIVNVNVNEGREKAVKAVKNPEIRNLGYLEDAERGLEHRT